MPDFNLSQELLQIAAKVWLELLVKLRRLNHELKLGHLKLIDSMSGYKKHVHVLKQQLVNLPHSKLK